MSRTLFKEMYIAILLRKSPTPLQSLAEVLKEM
jgi:hypothetical protein